MIPAQDITLAFSSIIGRWDPDVIATERGAKLVLPSGSYIDIQFASCEYEISFAMGSSWKSHPRKNIFSLLMARMGFNPQRTYSRWSDAENNSVRDLTFYAKLIEQYCADVLDGSYAYQDFRDR